MIFITQDGARSALSRHPGSSIQPARTLVNALAYLTGMLRGESPRQLSEMEQIFHLRNVELLAG